MPPINSAILKKLSKASIIHQRYNTVTRDTGCPPFLEVLSCLLSIILSLTMIGYLLRWLSAWNVQVIPFGVWVFFLAFCFIIVYCFARLIKGLFPAWRRPGPGGSLVVKMMEIDLVGE